MLVAATPRSSPPAPPPRPTRPTATSCAAPPPRRPHSPTSCHARVDQLAAADQARSRWLVHTAVTREAADRARAELAARGAAVGPEAGDAVTPAEWLAAHQAEQAEADLHRPITSEHDLADLGRQRDSDVAATTPARHAAETDVPDARDSRAADIPDERGRVPTAEDSAAAILRAQEALREIEQRRQLDQRRADEEDRVRQLTRWAADDALSAADVQADAATA